MTDKVETHWFPLAVLAFDRVSKGKGFLAVELPSLPCCRWVGYFLYLGSIWSSQVRSCKTLPTKLASFESSCVETFGEMKRNK